MQDYPSIAKFMATKLITFTPDTDIRKAITLMLRKGISGAPVLNERGELIGMISEVDCLQLLIKGPYNDEPGGNGTVSDFMSGKTRTISSDKTILDAAYEFVYSGYKRLPVIENGKLVGQISRVDVLRAIQKMRPEVQHVPDSWRKRMPAFSKNKTSRHTENS